MAFCASCGSQLDPGVKFCNKCGAGVASQPAPAAALPTVSPGSPAPSQGSSALIKILFAVLGVFAFVILAVAGSCVYIGYRVKQRAHEFTQQMGANAPAYAGRKEPCAKLSRAEAGSILGQPVQSVEQVGLSTCVYHFGEDRARRLDIEYTWEGGAMAMGFAHAAMKHVAGMETFSPVQGLGDEAYVGPGGSNFMMRKGDVLVTIDLRVTGVSAETAQKLAEKIASHL